MLPAACSAVAPAARRRTQAACADRTRLIRKTRRIAPAGFLLHDSLNRSRFKDNIMQPFKVLQRPLRV
ncbi:hypothetical protein ELH75_09235 [Rhizobium leguminosarum]|nr:hypothetical protein ELI50_06600 [Rhizobium leguminosarum]TAU40265.1 hypothetical protein ELI51_07340 [Rhizobium leguminosarum]TAY36847.1 hypothetical protein ELH89_06810 [Rhizobium leguminosarum]TAZ61392.1 hypothetical protein ELH75_09235 [Rhizobium leguminosarum]